jgi:hypothetical protein
MKISWRIKMKKIIKIYFIILLFISISSIHAQLGKYVNQNIDKFKGSTSDEIKTLLSLAVNNKDQLAVEKIIKLDTSNIIQLIELSTQLPPFTFKNPKNFNSDRIYFYDLLKNAFRNLEISDKKLYEYYFQYIFKGGEKALQYVTFMFESDYWNWYPYVLVKHHGMFLIFHHFLATKDYLKLTEKQKLIDFLSSLGDRISYYDIANIDTLDDFRFRTEKSKIYSKKDMKVISTSYLSKKYRPENMIDYNLNTVWAEGVKGSGIGEKIVIELKESIQIDTLIIFPGHSKSYKLFKANNRIRKLKLRINGESKIYLLQDKFLPVEIPICMKSNKIEIEILDVYKGYKYNDLCIGELLVIKKFTWQ